MFSGLFTKVKERSNSAEAIIRNPTAPKSNKKSFKDSAYFQEKLESRVGQNKTLKPVECSELEDLIVFGSSTLEMELKAAHAVGL